MQMHAYKVSRTGERVYSRKEGCTHALRRKSSGRVFSFYLSSEAALKGLGDWDVLNFNRMYGERVIETGRVWVLGSTALEALTSLEVHDRLTGQEGVHRDLRDVQEESYRGAMYQGFRVAGRDIEAARTRIAARKAWLRDVEVVSLDPV